MWVPRLEMRISWTFSLFLSVPHMYLQKRLTKRKSEFMAQSWDPSSPTLAAPHRAPNLQGEPKWQRNATQPAGLSSPEIKGRLLDVFIPALEMVSQAGLQPVCKPCVHNFKQTLWSWADSPGWLGGHSLSEHVLLPWAALSSAPSEGSHTARDASHALAFVCFWLSPLSALQNSGGELQGDLHRMQAAWLGCRGLIWVIKFASINATLLRVFLYLK